MEKFVSKLKWYIWFESEREHEHRNSMQARKNVKYRQAAEKFAETEDNTKFATYEILCIYIKSWFYAAGKSKKYSSLLWDRLPHF